MKTANLLANAKLARDNRIKILKACTCAWPLREVRTPSGHPKTCPAHKEWERQFNET